MGLLDGYKIGFIGLGLMGKPMAQNLKSAGADMIIHNRSQEVVNELKQDGMKPSKTPADLTRGLAEDDTVILMLPDTKSLEEVLLGTDGLMLGLQKSCLVIDMGTSSVGSTKILEKRYFELILNGFL